MSVCDLAQCCLVCKHWYNIVNDIIVHLPCGLEGVHQTTLEQLNIANLLSKNLLRNVNFEEGFNLYWKDNTWSQRKIRGTHFQDSKWFDTRWKQMPIKDPIPGLPHVRFSAVSACDKPVIRHQATDKLRNLSKLFHNYDVYLDWSAWILLVDEPAIHWNYYQAGLAGLTHEELYSAIKVTDKGWHFCQSRVRLQPTDYNGERDLVVRYYERMSGFSVVNPTLQLHLEQKTVCDCGDLVCFLFNALIT